MLDKLLHIAQKRLPSLEGDPEFIKYFNSFVEILNGKGYYKAIVNGPAFAEFNKSLNEPNSHVNVVPQNYKILKDQ